MTRRAECIKIIRSGLRYRRETEAVEHSAQRARENRGTPDIARRPLRDSVEPGGGEQRRAAAADRRGPFALAAVCCLPLVALAQAPDLDAGRAVVVGGEDGSITPCFMCHGLDGVGDPPARSRG